MDTEKKYELIEKYLSKEMEEDELKNFENQLQANHELKEELDLHQQVANTLKGDKIHDLRNVLHDVDKNWEATPKKDEAKIISFNFKMIASIAAAIVLLFFAYQIFISPKPSTTELYASNFEAYPMLLNQRSVADSEVNKEILNRAISNYSKQQFGEATINFEKLLKSDPENISFQFYSATTLLASGKASDAISIFKDILVKEDHLFTEQTRWYLALAYLKIEDKKNAKIMLQNIQSQQYNYQKANEILENL